MKKILKSKYSIFIISLALVLVVAVGGTLAYIVTSAGPVVNTFNPSDVQITVQETFNETTKSDVKIQNTGTAPAYVRAKVVINWVDANNNIVPSVPEGYTYTNPWTHSTKWFKCTSDGFYYYESPVDPNGTTQNLIDTITYYAPTASPEYKLQVQIISQAIQATPTDVVETKWGVTVQDDGTISK